MEGGSVKYRFFIYRGVFYPGQDTAPEERVIETDDPEAKAKELCKGAVDRVDWEAA